MSAIERTSATPQPLSRSEESLVPGDRIALLGGGQLGRYLVISARAAGFKVTVLDPDPMSPAGALADKQIVAAYDAPHALAELAATCSAATTEFENVPAEALDTLAQHMPVAPSSHAVSIAQNRLREKAFFAENGLPIGPYLPILSRESLPEVIDSTLFPAVLKTARFGYDGKGQAVLATEHDLRTHWEAHPDWMPAILEKRLNLQREISVVLARSRGGEVATFPVSENQHVNGILDITIAPARISQALANEAKDAAIRLAHALNYVGVMAVEFFVVDGDQLVLNEMAPRPHNSGHYTLDACSVSQFDQQLRVVTGYLPAEITMEGAAVMVNLLGDIWSAGEPNWPAILNEPKAHLHLYGKEEARPGRKMGHFTVRGKTPDETLRLAQHLRLALTRQP